MGCWWLDGCALVPATSFGRENDWKCLQNFESTSGILGQHSHSLFNELIDFFSLEEEAK